MVITFLATYATFYALICKLMIKTVSWVRGWGEDTLMIEIPLEPLL
jgi:hypothetical protein